MNVYISGLLFAAAAMISCRAAEAKEHEHLLHSPGIVSIHGSHGFIDA
jgi:hypothetical protein